MSLKDYGHEDLKAKSMIELGQLVLQDEKKAMDFRDIFNKIAEIKGFIEAEKQERIIQFYTDLNLEGRFITIGSNMWGLKRWYPIDQIDEEVTVSSKQKKKKGKVEKKQPKAEKKPEKEDKPLEDGGWETVAEAVEDAEFEDESLDVSSDEKHKEKDEK